MAAAAAILTLQIYFPAVMIIASALLCAISVVEILFFTNLNKNKFMVAAASAFSAFAVLGNGFLKTDPGIMYVLFVMCMFALFLAFHNSIKIEGMLATLIFPIFLSYSFKSLCDVTLANKKLFYILLILCWSAIADTGAYFTGVLFGKHKMSPEISPKKTYEGLAGGMFFSLVFAALLCLIYNSCLNSEVSYAAVLIATPVFVLVGVMGDLSASLIKRYCNIKDFGTVIPGHGGILDRFDSILMIVPLCGKLIECLPLIK